MRTSSYSYRIVDDYLLIIDNSSNKDIVTPLLTKKTWNLNQSKHWQQTADTDQRIK